ncbi:protoporphyrinogen/coproporphyrinogen oxidase [Ectothiorhodospira marina]|jgi:phytoene dehydrogenase-like protein|uniref:Phytoene dehydrogenase-related protein n=1 Tax=Ectothiorhodospira marina TaxID=1396821 RepID=A0A1H7LS68_9GAMM|nr:NAD(P)/FAD-dependent oxidoreductase [Ectothiorhodospira marina]SEL01315.1 Phytoene dehydrogenase-related protein [Ectothiorhodospira marina]
MSIDVAIIGGGLSGLACALSLREQGREPLILEASDEVGGRIRTDYHDGFLLDRGFQVLQTWYPEARRFLDYDSLDLRAFQNGALVRINGHACRVSDVWRQPGRLPEMLWSPVGHLSDKIRLLHLRHRCLQGDLTDLYRRHERDAITHLAELGFSQRIIDRFFKPFFSGVFFEPELHVSSRAFEFVFRAFALGETALPAKGMEQIPRQLAARLPRDTIQLHTRVERIEGDLLYLTSGEVLRARVIVLATEGPETARLLGQNATDVPTRGTTCLYFSANQPPFEGRNLMLNGEGKGCINNVLCPSVLSEHYAPAGKTLVSVNVHGADHDLDALEGRVRHELTSWFGDEIQHWQHLATYSLPHALPMQAPPVHNPAEARLQQRQNVWSCGEYDSAPSIHWALHRGRRSAEELVAADR